MKNFYARVSTQCLLALTLLSASVAQAADQPPPLGEVKGVLVETISIMQAFTFSAPAVATCETREIGTIIRQICKLSSPHQLALANGALLTVDSLDYWYKSVSLERGGAYVEYHYHGAWQKTVDGNLISSPAELLLWHTALNPLDIKGSLSLQALGVSASVVGSVAAR